MGLFSEIFGNLLFTKHSNYDYQFQSFLGVLCFKPISKYCNVWYEKILRISQWSDTGPSCCCSALIGLLQEGVASETCSNKFLELIMKVRLTDYVKYVTILFEKILGKEKMQAGSILLFPKCFVFLPVYFEKQ